MVVWAKRAAAALALALLAGSPAGAQVPDPYARELAQQLARSDSVLGEGGYSRAAGPFAGGLAQRESRRFTLSLRAGQDYRIVGVCDLRCGALDLRLFDANEASVGQAVLENGVPALYVRPAATGPHVVEVEMLRCGGAPCWYAVNVYSR